MTQLRLGEFASLIFLLLLIYYSWMKMCWNFFPTFPSQSAFFQPSSLLHRETVWSESFLLGQSKRFFSLADHKIFCIVQVAEVSSELQRNERSNWHTFCCFSRAFVVGLYFFFVFLAIAWSWTVRVHRSCVGFAKLLQASKSRPNDEAWKGERRSRTCALERSWDGEGLVSVSARSPTFSH